jgi:cell wall-associated NlpC family hydrolase
MEYRDLVGIPFVDGGRDPATGLDCWGIVMAAMRKLGKEVPDFKISCWAVRDIAGAFAIAVLDFEKAEGPAEGTIVAMAQDPEHPDTVQHFGVCIGGGRFLHAMEKIRSCAPRLDHPFWKNRIRGYYRWTG